MALQKFKARADVAWIHCTRPIRESILPGWGLPRVYGRNCDNQISTLQDKASGNDFPSLSKPWLKSGTRLTAPWTPLKMDSPAQDRDVCHHICNCPLRNIISKRPGYRTSMIFVRLDSLQATRQVRSAFNGIKQSLTFFHEHQVISKASMHRKQWFYIPYRNIRSPPPYTQPLFSSTLSLNIHQAC